MQWLDGPACSAQIYCVAGSILVSAICSRLLMMYFTKLKSSGVKSRGQPRWPNRPWGCNPSTEAPQPTSIEDVPSPKKKIRITVAGMPKTSFGRRTFGAAQTRLNSDVDATQVSQNFVGCVRDLSLTLLHVAPASLSLIPFGNELSEHLPPTDVPACKLVASSDSSPRHRPPAPSNNPLSYTPACHRPRSLG